jgi:two-component system response regulator AtoC
MARTRKDDFGSTQALPPEDVIFGSTPPMRVARERLLRVADTTLPVLLQGESGTGKDILARLIHARSRRAQQPFVRVNCPTIPTALIETELFGFERGAFTGAYGTRKGRVELAHTGTLFLDDVGALEDGSQAKLLQVLQDGTFMRVGAQNLSTLDTRLICAANSNLKQQSIGGNFRPDFYFRISAVTITLPALRQRIADLPFLVDYFIGQYANLFQVNAKPVSRDFMKWMQLYGWPGNIRQLENVIRSYVLMGDEEASIADLIPASPESILTEIDVTKPISLKRIMKAATGELEREIILKVLRAKGWNRQKSARWLNISYRGLLYKMQELQMGTLQNAEHKAEMSPSGAAACRVTAFPESPEEMPEIDKDMPVN